MSYSETQQHYRDLLLRYQDPPRGDVGTEVLEAELEKAERRLLDDAPPSFGRGLVTFEEVRANATPERLADLCRLEIPPAPRLSDEPKFVLYPEREWTDVIQEKKSVKAENSGLVLHTLDQNGYGSCASEAISGITMALENKAGIDPVEKLNPYALYGLVNDGADRGSSLTDNMAAIVKYGVPTQRVWPRSKGWRKRLSDEAKQDALRHRIHEFWRVGNKQEFASALLHGMFVYFGYPGHAIFATDLIDTRRFRYKNSWGESFGDNGFATLTWSRVEWSYGAWAIRTCRRAS
jgi:hypothetical protein